MKQNQYSPMSVAEMAVSIFAANEGHLQELEVSQVLPFETALHSYMNSEHGDLMNEIAQSGAWNDEIAGTFKAAVEKFKATQSW
jgi:F-type H+-transporting ATPase subunit alpha